MTFPPGFDHAWDITAPADTQAANLLGQDIRNLKDDIMQRLSLLSGILANRPTPETVNATWGGSGFGIIYISTDTNQIFQWDGSSWVLVLINNLVASVTLNGQNAVIGSTLLYAVPASGAGLYRVSWSTVVTTAGTAGTIGPVVSWNNGAAAQNLSGPIENTSFLGSEIGNSNRNDFVIYSAASQNINYLTAGTPGAGSVYSLNIRLAYLD